MRKNLQKLCIVIPLALILSACNERTMDVDYYLQHPDIRGKTLKECQKNPGEKNNSPNCKNSSIAEFKSAVKSKKMPTIK